MVYLYNLNIYNSKLSDTYLQISGKARVGVDKLRADCHQSEGKKSIFCKIETSLPALSRKFASERQLLFIFSSRFPTFSTNKNEWSFFEIQFYFAERIWNNITLNYTYALQYCSLWYLYQRKTVCNFYYAFWAIFYFIHVLMWVTE